MSAPVAPAPASPSPPEALAALCRQRQWNAVIDRARAHPADVKSAVAGRGTLPPLHVACENGAPIQVIKALLSANAAAAQTKAGLHDRLPLHCLLAAANAFPLVDSVVSALVEAYPGACRVPDKGGSLPIHLACQSAPVSDDIFTSLLSMHPEGAYARNHAGNYPLHIAAANKDVKTKKIALAALDRGTLYASISKMTALRLSKEHQEETRALEKAQADKLSKMEAHAKEERSKLKGQMEELRSQLKSEKEANAKLLEEKKATAVKHEEELALVVKKEQAKANEMEKGLREELAGVQLKNMDLIDQVEGVQAELDASNEKVQKQANDIAELEGSLNGTSKTLEETKACLVTTTGALKETQDKLSTTEASNGEKDQRIQHVEESLASAREYVLALAEEQERMNVAMAAQREALASLLLGHDAAMSDAGALKERMAGLATDIGRATKKNESSEVHAEEEDTKEQ